MYNAFCVHAYILDDKVHVSDVPYSTCLVCSLGAIELYGSSNALNLIPTVLIHNIIILSFDPKVLYTNYIYKIISEYYCFNTIYVLCYF